MIQKINNQIRRWAGVLTVASILLEGCATVQSPEPVPRTEESRILEEYRRPWAYTRDRSGRYRWTNRPAEPIEYGEK